MFGYRREMYALQLKYLYIALLIIASIGFNEAITNGRSKRRFGTKTSKASSDEATEKSAADQTISASTNTESNKYRRGGSYSTDAGDYSYNSADINVIRPESKPVHTKITAKYTSSITIPHDSFEDTETAEEYVAKAMGLYGSRLREPIRIPNEVEPTQAEQPMQQQQQQQYQQHLQQQQQQHHHEYEQHEQRLQQQQHQLEQHEQRLQQHQHQHEQHEQNLQNQEKQTKNFDYFNYIQKQAQPQAATPIEEEEPQQPQQQQQQIQVPYHQYAPTSAQSQTENDAKQLVEAQIQAQLHEQIQQAQYLTQERQQEQAQAEEQIKHEQSPAPVSEKDPVTRSYNVYDEQTEGYDSAQQSVVDRNYRTKYNYKPSSQYQIMANENEEKIRVSASTEIPKAEIMKQIEKSVIKYMKELEAEGKIIAAPHKEEPKTYYKVITVAGSDEKRIGSTTAKPVKYVSSPSGNYQDPFKHSPSHASAGSSSSSQKYHKHSVAKPSYQTETESSYQAGAQDVSELAPNVEFIYKIKTKAPLHTATVKTVSKPYNLPVKSYEQFDHSSALKNLEDFDLSHVVSTGDPEDHQSASTSKPSKLYFNSEIYHDINSLPYKQKQQRAEAEYRKLKAAAAEIHPDYKGYSSNSGSSQQSGYYAEPPAERDSERDTSGSNASDDGYPIMNPYKYVFKKEALPGKYDESSGSYEQQQHKYKSTEYDSYNPKFNNNPEVYGYQQTYKTHLPGRHSPGKRGKRGGSPYPNLNKKSPHRSSTLKEFEDFALRPPPKN